MLKNYLTYENLGADFENLAVDVRSGLPTAVFGVSFAEKCHLATVLDSPILYLVKDNLYGARIVEQLKALSGEEVVLLNSKDDVLLYKNAFNKESLYNRLKALYKIKKGAKIIFAPF